MVKTVLEVKSLSKKFGDFTAVDNISFSVEKGEIVGLLGPNGAGKTTTIQMILGTVEPSGGEINVLGKKMPQDRVEILKEVNYSSTYVRMPLFLTVKENLSIFSLLYEVEDKEKEIARVLHLFGIWNLRYKLWYKLSSGQATRVHLCKALLNHPKILFLDEPTASLDPEVAQKTRDLLKKIRREQAVTTFLTSHNMAEVEELCDRVIILSQGKILAQDTPEGLAHKITKVCINLMISDGKERFIALAGKNGWDYSFEDRFVEINVYEAEIAAFLAKLAQAGIYYKEISIDKPTLEDYFLSVVKRKNKT